MKTQRTDCTLNMQSAPLCLSSRGHLFQQPIFLKSYMIDLVYLNNWVVLFLCNFQTCFRDDYMTAEQWYMMVIYIPITCLQLQWIFDGVWFIWSVIQSPYCRLGCVWVFTTELSFKYFSFLPPPISDSVHNTYYIFNDWFTPNISNNIRDFVKLV